MAVALAFVAYTAWTLHQRWEPGQLHVDAWLVVLSTLPLALGVLLQAWAWVRLVRRMSGTPVGMQNGMRLYLDSQLARYAPGKVGLPLVRIEGGVRLGLGAALVGSSIIAETLCWAVVGGVVSMLVMAGSSRQKSAMFAMLGDYSVPLLALFTIGLLALVLVDRRRFPAFALRALRLGGEGPLVPVELPIILLGHWATWAIHGYLISRAVGAPPEDAASAVGAFLVAPLGGFLIVAAPAGLGVREALLSLALAPAVGSAGALATAVLSRICTLAAEVSCWAVLRASPGVGP
jgi:glycosyltransferase 2 family protein